MAGKRRRPDISILVWSTNVEVVGTTQRGVLYLLRTEPTYPRIELNHYDVREQAAKWQKDDMLVEITEL